MRIVTGWRRLCAASLPACTLRGSTTHDPFPGTPAEGLRLAASVTVEPDAGTIAIDLRDNPDNLPNGLNLTRATATAAALTGALSALPTVVPTNSGTFRRFDVLLREGCVVGIPRFPHSCSSATTNLADRVIGLVQAAFAQLGDDFGAAEGAVGQAPAKSVISGVDPRNDRPYVNQIIVGGVGGPATAFVDGWPTYQRPVAGALIYHDSIEIDEQRYPVLISERRLVADSGGAGRLRGGLATRVSLVTHSTHKDVESANLVARLDRRPCRLVLPAPDSVHRRSDLRQIAPYLVRARERPRTEPRLGDVLRLQPDRQRAENTCRPGHSPPVSATSTSSPTNSTLRPFPASSD